MSEKKKLEAYYGLPEEVRFCTKCVMSNQRPTSAIEFKHTKDSKKTTMNFDEDGVCDACRTAEIKDNIDSRDSYLYMMTMKKITEDNRSLYTKLS